MLALPSEQYRLLAIVEEQAQALRTMSALRDSIVRRHLSGG